MDSFFLAEMFKYLYLLFSEKSQLPIDIDEYIFTTEAHLLPVSLSTTQATCQGNATVRALTSTQTLLIFSDLYKLTCASHAVPYFSQCEHLNSLLSFSTATEKGPWKHSVCCLIFFMSSEDCSCFSRWRSVHALLSQRRDIVPQQPLICQIHQGWLQVPHWGGTSLPPSARQVWPLPRDLSDFSSVIAFDFKSLLFTGKLNYRSTIVA